MYSALKKAGKEATLVKLNGKGHWLSNSKTRLQALMAIDQFLDIHNPAVLN
jgi:dipeptidyl aminopeptidase/acylaminoacyl peptidase